MKRFWFLIKRKVVPAHKKLKKILEELKIYCETLIMILIAFMTIKVSLAANAISEKQTELTERQTILAEKQYKNEYSPRLVVKDVDISPSIMAENLLNYYYFVDTSFFDDLFMSLDLFSDFHVSIFEDEEFYQLILKSDNIGSFFLENGLNYFDPNVNIGQFKDIILNLNDKDKKILNREFNRLFWYSGDQYVLENIGDKVINGSIQYEINISIHIPNSSGNCDSYNVLLKDVGYPYCELKENIIIIQCLNPVLIQYMINDFESYLEKELDDENIYINYDDCICVEYDDNKDFVSENYYIYDYGLEPFNDNYYETFSIYENIDKEEILSYIKEQLSLAKR